ncbi:MAG: acylphosphatase [Thermoplasmata archaeon]|nr:acylphosphatase [Thermoplasmata archaeon]
MKKRVVLRAVGEVQKVGYRDFVQKVARKLGVVGHVENMRDGSVQIVCEGEEAVIGAFQKAIKVKADFIDVNEVKTLETKNSTDEFEYFDIKYGSAEEELGERMGAGILYMAATRDEVKSMHTDMNTRFDTLDSKYGEFGKDVKAIRQDITDMKMLANEFREFKDLFAIYVKHQLGKASE